MTRTRIRGARTPIPGGTLMGRKLVAGQKKGDMQPLSVQDLKAFGLATGQDVANAVATIPPPLALPVSVADGGTGVDTLTAHGVLIGDGTDPVAVTGAGTAGQVLTSNGALADPTFQSPAATFRDWRPLVNGSLPGAIVFDGNGAVIAVFI